MSSNASKSTIDISAIRSSSASSSSSASTELLIASDKNMSRASKIESLSSDVVFSSILSIASTDSVSSITGKSSTSCDSLERLSKSKVS